MLQKLNPNSTNFSNNSMEVIGRWRTLAIPMILIAVMLLTIWVDREAQKSLEMVSHTYEVQVNLSGLLSTLQDMETGQRGFLLTGDDEYLEPFNSGVGAAGVTLETIKKLTSDNIVQQNNIMFLLPSIEAKTNELEETINVRREQGFDAALQIVQTNLGKQVMDDIRVMIAAMDTEEQSLLVARQEDYENKRILAFTMNFLAMVLIIGVLVTTLRRLTDFIAYRNKTESTLRTAKDQAEQANIAKSEFLATVSHELRTPLTSIKGALDMVRSGKFGTLDPRAEPLAKIAADNSGRLIYLVNDLLDMEKLKTGALELKMEEVNLYEVLDDAMTQISPMASDSNIQIVFDKTEEDCPLDCDGNRISQVVTNLLSNAIKFSPKGSLIQLGLEKTDHYVKISVQDNGLGIPENIQKNLFERFTQGDSSDTRNHDGTGLGLAIARAIVGLHGGQIGVNSEIGKGSTFYFDLPLYDIQDSTMENSKGILGNETDNRHIIIVEDDLDLSVLMQIALEEESFEVSLAQNVKEARDLLMAETFLAAVIDINLPDGDGLSLLQEIRKGNKNKNLPVIIASGSVSLAAGKSKTLALKNIDWLQKPYDQTNLINLLKGYKKCTVGNPCSILHIEDDLDLQAILERQIGAKAKVTSATSIGQTRTLLTDNKYDLIILDASLPDGNGLDLISELKEKNGVDAPIVILSGTETAKDVAEQVSAAFLKGDRSAIELIEAIFSYLPENSKGLTG